MAAVGAFEVRDAAIGKRVVAPHDAGRLRGGGSAANSSVPARCRQRPRRRRRRTGDCGSWRRLALSIGTLAAGGRAVASPSILRREYLAADHARARRMHDPNISPALASAFRVDVAPVAGPSLATP